LLVVCMGQGAGAMGARPSALGGVTVYRPRQGVTLLH
jgi:hypothetical protein